MGLGKVMQFPRRKQRIDPIEEKSKEKVALGKLGL